MARSRSFQNAEVAAVFAEYAPALRAKLLLVRDIIYDVAEHTAGVGELEEALKWGQPSYLTPKTRSGSTVRIDGLKGSAGYAIYFHCQTHLIEAFKEQYSDVFTYEGNRAIIFSEKAKLPMRALRGCIELALTYHLRKKMAKH